MTVHPTLPQELIGEVVDHLGDDSDTLQACSLVSWAWVSRSRSYLFETCFVTSKTIALFRDLLLSTDCTFSSHIRRIQASRYSGSHDDHIFDDIAPAVRSLKDIRELYIQMTLSIVHAGAYPYFFTGFITAFPHATRLDLSFTVEHTSKWHVTAPLFETISFFPALRELHVLELWQDTWDSSTTRVPPPNLHCLELHGDSIDLILTWLNTSSHLRNLDSLALSSPHIGNAPIVRAAMQQIGRSLRHLDIDLDNPEVDHASLFDLRTHPNLKTLVIRHEGPDGRPQQFDPTLLFLIVTSLAAPTFEHLSLELSLLYYERLDWTALAAFLSRTRFPNLRQAVVKCSHHDGKYCDDHREVRDALAGSEVFQTEW